MKKTRASLLICLLVFFSTNVLVFKIDSPSSKPVYGKKILVSNQNNVRLQH
jgi:hypothetical protein